MDPTVDVPMPDGAAGVAATIAVPDLDQRLEPRVVAYWLIADTARALVLASMLIGGAEIWRARDAAHAWALPWAWAVGGLLVALALIAPPLAYARWRFSADGRLLSMRYGILFVEERRVPVPRMQHVDLMRGPIERLFGLATLVVFTAGNEGSAFRVPGLLRARAEALRDGILQARGRDVV